MKLTEEVKKQITDILDSEEFMHDLYAGLDEKKRIELGQFYTPGKICIQMIEKFSWDTLEGKNIIDPTCGSGNLLIACLIAGADLDKLYGNEYDAIAVKLCRKRLLRAAEKLNLDLTKFRDWQIHQGNALQARCLITFSEYYIRQYNPNYIDDLDYAQTYDHEETIEVDYGICGKQIEVKKYKALSWDTENIKAAERKNAKLKAETKRAAELKAKEVEATYEQVSIF